MDEDHVHETDVELVATSKRRKVRKGTRSCWDCKRRKMKCLFDGSLTGTKAEVCIGCKKRGSKCVSQEFDIPDELSTPRKTSQGQGRTKGDDHERVMRVEALLHQMVKKANTDGTAITGTSPTTSEDGSSLLGMPTPVSIDSGSSSRLHSQKSSDKHHRHTTFQLDSKCERLIRDLYDALPSREDIDILCKARSPMSILIYERSTTPYTDINENGLRSPESLLEIPGPNAHPVLMARYLLYLATFLQQFRSKSPKEIEELSAPPQVMLKRVAETAISFITTKDELLGSLEGLECIMLESLYQHNAGNLRRGWVAMRKAMVIAQLMGLHRPGSQAQYKVLDPKTTFDPQFMWFRILFYDRHFCLMLGLPQGSVDRSIAREQMLTNDTPMGRLERMHCVLASRILELNESDPSTHRFALIQELDEGLQRAARTLPPKWWLPPIMASSDSMVIFETAGRLFNQLFHYNLLNQLHLPFMLRSSTERKYDYSKITCVNASREVLTRFIISRSFNEGRFSCRPLDFFSLMAAMTLLLAHLDSHRYPQTDNILAHQYLSDRAMVEQTQENMEEMGHQDGDPLTVNCAALLRRLLAILGEAADGNTDRVESVSVSVKAPETEMEQPGEDNSSVVRFFVPYCGIINIAREGVISKEIPKAQYSLASNMQNELNCLSETPDTEVMTSIEHSQGCIKELPSMLRPRLATHASMQAQPRHLPDPPTSFNTAATQLAPQFLSTFYDSPLQQYESPILTAGIDDWAFQGVDTAFFNSVMRGVEEDGNDDAEWAHGMTGLES